MSEESLREFIRETLKVSKPFDNDLEDDESYKKKSVYVPDDIKNAISKWKKSMKL